MNVDIPLYLIIRSGKFINDLIFTVIVLCLLYMMIIMDWQYDEWWSVFDWLTSNLSQKSWQSWGCSIFDILTEILMLPTKRGCITNITSRFTISYFCIYNSCLWRSCHFKRFCCLLSGSSFAIWLNIFDHSGEIFSHNERQK